MEYLQKENSESIKVAKTMTQGNREARLEELKEKFLSLEIGKKTSTSKKSVSMRLSSLRVFRTKQPIPVIFRSNLLKVFLYFIKLYYFNFDVLENLLLHVKILANT